MTLDTGIIVRNDSLYNGDEQFIVGCKLEDEPEADQIRWYRANSELQDGYKYSVDHQQGTLTINDAGKAFLFFFFFFYFILFLFLMDMCCKI